MCLTGQERDVNSAAVKLSALDFHYSSRRAETELGYVTRPFQQTVRDTWDWFCREGYARPRRGASTLAPHADTPNP